MGRGERSNNKAWDESFRPKNRAAARRVRFGSYDVTKILDHTRCTQSLERVTTRHSDDDAIIPYVLAPLAFRDSCFKSSCITLETERAPSEEVAATMTSASMQMTRHACFEITSRVYKLSLCIRLFNYDDALEGPSNTVAIMPP